MAITLAVDGWLLETLTTFSCGEDHEENGDGEPDDEAEVDGPPFLQAF